LGKSSKYKVNLYRLFRTSRDEVLYGLCKTGCVARLEEKESMQNILGGKFMDKLIFFFDRAS